MWRYLKHMDLPSFVPTPEEGLDLLSPVGQHLQSAYDNAVFEARAYDDAKGLNCDRSTFLTIVRAHAKSYLVRQKFSGVEFKDWSLSGIEWRVGDATFRSWKGDEALPFPGDSKGKMRFLNQQYDLPFDQSGLAKLRNFVVLYSLDASDKITLRLVCPKKYDAEEKVSEVWWGAEIPDPISSLANAAKIQPRNDLSIAAIKVPKVGTLDG
jgi:hypothetical protein